MRFIRRKRKRKRGKANGSDQFLEVTKEIGVTPQYHVIDLNGNYFFFFFFAKN